KIIPASQKIYKSETAAYKKQIKGQTGFLCVAQNPAGQLPDHSENGNDGRNDRQQICGAKIGTQHAKDAGYGFAEKRIPEAVFATQKGIGWRKLSALRDVLNEPQVHGRSEEHTSELQSRF